MRVFLLGVLLLTAAACLADFKVVTGKVGGSGQVQLAVQQLVIVRLLAPNATNYNWSVGDNDESLLSMESADLKPVSFQGTTTQTFNLMGMRSGSEKLTFTLTKNGKPVGKYSLFVKVGRGGSIQKVLVLSDKDNGKEGIGLHEGQIIEIRLKANPTTGYQWRGDLIPRLLTPVGGLDYVPSTPGRASAGGMTTVRYRAALVGRGVLQLVYARSKGAPARKFRVTFQSKR